MFFKSDTCPPPPNPVYKSFYPRGTFYTLTSHCPFVPQTPPPSPPPPPLLLRYLHKMSMEAAPATMAIDRRGQSHAPDPEVDSRSAGFQPPTIPSPPLPTVVFHVAMLNLRVRVYMLLHKILIRAEKFVAGKQFLHGHVLCDLLSRTPVDQIPEHTLAPVYCCRSCVAGAMLQLLVLSPNKAKVTCTQKKMGMHHKHDTQPPPPTSAPPPPQKFSKLLWRLPQLPWPRVANHMPPIAGPTHRAPPPPPEHARTPCRGAWLWQGSPGAGPRPTGPTWPPG